MAAYYSYQLNYETCQAIVIDLTGKSKINYYYSSKVQPFPTCSSWSIQPRPGPCQSRLSCHWTTQLCQAEALNTASDYIHPGIFLACAEINKHRLNRALEIKEKENAEEVCQRCQTNEALSAWTFH